jgi:hypothetical protein
MLQPIASAAWLSVLIVVKSMQIHEGWELIAITPTAIKVRSG